jgi:hypothetical protein
MPGLALAPPALFEDVLRQMIRVDALGRAMGARATWIARQENRDSPANPQRKSRELSSRGQGSNSMED